ncbi:MAG: hypothetical protein J6U23_11510 [Clostridiales bacterium]|nr:hypothetical protein [Clostridiales bacterium]
MRKNKLSKFLISMLAVIVAFGAMMIATSGKVLADDEDIYANPEHPAIYYRYNFEYNDESGWYEASGGYYRLLTQSKIASFDGHLPDDIVYYGPSTTYILYEDIELTGGLSGYTNRTFSFDLNYNTITYNPEDPSEYFLEADIPEDEGPCMCNFFNGSILNPKGAPLFRLGGNSTRKCSLMLSGITLDGGATELNPDGYSAITLFNGANCTLGDGTIIRNFTSKRGAAVCCTLNGSAAPTDYLVRVDSAYITNCKAYEGGAIYSEGPVNLAGNSPFSGIRVYNTDIENNYAEYKGGAVCLEGPYAYVSLGTCRLADNVCNSPNSDTTGGGAIFCGGEGTRTNYFASTTKGYSSTKYVTALIKGNSANGVESNLYFANNGIYDCLFVTDNLFVKDYVKIGISRNNPSDGDCLAKTSSGGFSDTANLYFVSDDYDFSVERSDKSSYSEAYYSLILINSNGGTEPMVLKGLSLIIDSQREKMVGLKVYVYIPDGSTYPELSNWSGTLTPTEGNRFYMAGDEVNSSEVVKEENILKFTFPIDVEDMTVPLELSVKYDGSEILTYSTISVSSYAAAVLENPGKYNVSDSEDAVIALVNYGAAAQKYFKFRTDDLADKVLSPEQQSKINDFDMSKILDDVYFDGYCRASNKGDKIKLTSMSVIFGSTPTLKFYFSVKDGVTPVFTGYSQSLVYEGVYQGNGVYTVKVPCSQYFAEMFDVYAYDSENLSSNECQISVNIAYYLRNCYVTDGYSANMKNLAKSYLIYVYSFLHSL